MVGFRIFDVGLLIDVWLVWFFRLRDDDDPSDDDGPGGGGLTSDPGRGRAAAGSAARWNGCSRAAGECAASTASAPDQGVRGPEPFARIEPRGSGARARPCRRTGAASEEAQPQARVGVAYARQAGGGAAGRGGVSWPGVSFGGGAAVPPEPDRPTR